MKLGDIKGAFLEANANGHRPIYAELPPGGVRVSPGIFGPNHWKHMWASGHWNVGFDRGAAIQHLKQITSLGFSSWSLLITNSIQFMLGIQTHGHRENAGANDSKAKCIDLTALHRQKAHCHQKESIMVDGWVFLQPVCDIRM
jgi:hypothetical protein